MVLTLISDKKWVIAKLLSTCQMSRAEPLKPADETVINENNLVNKINKEDKSMALIVKNVVKQYSLGTYAVKGISFHLENGRCFGLLGSNGAGKTTTLKMLIGESKKV